MAPVEGSPGVFSIVVHLPPGCASTDFRAEHCCARCAAIGIEVLAL